MLKELGYGIPKWFADALGVPWGKDEVPMLDNYSGFDHVRTYKERVVISQPYMANAELGSILVKLHRQDISIKLWGVSPYFPGRTFSLVFWRPEDDAIAKEIMGLMAKSQPEKPEGPSHQEWS